jgi:hypothetical protein
VELISFEDLVDMGKPEAAIRKIKASEKPELAVYRAGCLN